MISTLYSNQSLEWTAKKLAATQFYVIYPLYQSFPFHFTAALSFFYYYLPMPDPDKRATIVVGIIVDTPPIFTGNFFHFLSPLKIKR